MGRLGSFGAAAVLSRNRVLWRSARREHALARQLGTLRLRRGRFGVTGGPPEREEARLRRYLSPGIAACVAVIARRRLAAWPCPHPGALPWVYGQEL